MKKQLGVKKQDGAKNKRISLMCAFLFSTFVLVGCDRVCVGSFCLGSGLTVKQRIIDTENHHFQLTGDLQGEFNAYSFKMGDEETVEKLSFGIYEADNFKSIAASKKILVLKDDALQMYREQYVIPGKGCPASFMNQHLENLVLLPADDTMAKALDKYDIPFDGRGTSFKLKGRHLTPEQSYFIRDGKKLTLDPLVIEDVFSNVGSAQRPIHYFLVTAIEQ